MSCPPPVINFWSLLDCGLVLAIPNTLQLDGLVLWHHWVDNGIKGIWCFRRFCMILEVAWIFHIQKLDRFISVKCALACMPIKTEEYFFIFHAYFKEELLIWNNYILQYKNWKFELSILLSINYWRQYLGRIVDLIDLIDQNSLIKLIDRESSVRHQIIMLVPTISSNDGCVISKVALNFTIKVSCNTNEVICHNSVKFTVPF